VVAIYRPNARSRLADVHLLIVIQNIRLIKTIAVVSENKVYISLHKNIRYTAYVMMYMRDIYMVFPGEVTVRSKLLIRDGPVFPFTPGGSNQESVTLHIKNMHASNLVIYHRFS
jgi:hypothetical protein